VAKLRLPEKIARSLTEGEIPALDRPVRFVVARGQRGSVRARTLDELQTLLDAPWTDEEVARFNRKRDEQREEARGKRRDRVAHEPKRGLREGRGRSQRPGRSERQNRQRDDAPSTDGGERPRGPGGRGGARGGRGTGGRGSGGRGPGGRRSR